MTKANFENIAEQTAVHFVINSQFASKYVIHGWPCIWQYKEDTLMAFFGHDVTFDIIIPAKLQKTSDYIHVVESI